ncbi:hypothetical protein DPMN_027221 [Dreissena polymorpha]|uniref:Uncharacterized protein n=1 Tax=Dreissena polymorpha TaxID=45954 RepID=A0A9D4LTY3_DREPO|nr:hypothetical protein DPMN_027221 [Dreissena polymorpha]
MPEVSNNIAIVEYIGSFPERQGHGSVKDIDKNVKYIRTKPRVLRHLERKVKHRSVKDVEWEENNLQTSDFEKQHNQIQLRNMKYQLNKTDTHWPSNTADQIITLEEHTNIIICPNC